MGDENVAVGQSNVPQCPIHRIPLKAGEIKNVGQK